MIIFLVCTIAEAAEANASRIAQALEVDMDAEIRDELIKASAQEKGPAHDTPHARALSFLAHVALATRCVANRAGRGSGGCRRR